jgi:PTH1 family peptidyl-tRNA hydrolase
MIKLFVGLGNPGPEYELTRHNAGFWWIDNVAHELGVTLRDERAYYGEMARVNVNGHSVWLLKPQTFMNLSGKSIGALARFYKIVPEEILVVHDELDLEPGHSKLKLGGSHAGHNGLRDTHQHLGTDQYWRLRIGIGHPGHRSDVVSWVLGKPILAQREAIGDCITRTIRAFEPLAEGEMEKATRIVHKNPARPKPPKPPKAPKPAPDTAVTPAPEDDAPPAAG